MDYRPIGRQYAQQQGVPWEWFERAINMESRWDPNIPDSPAGARGIAQLMPVHWTQVNPNDPRASLAYAARYLRQNYDRFGSWPLAFAAYNWGPGNLSQWGGNIARLPGETLKYLDGIFGARAAWAALIGGGGPDPVPVDPIEEEQQPDASWGQYIGEGIVSGVGAAVKGYFKGTADRAANITLGVIGAACVFVGTVGLVLSSRKATAAATGGALGGPAGALGGVLADTSGGKYLREQAQGAASVLGGVGVARAASSGGSGASFRTVVRRPASRQPVLIDSVPYKRLR